MLKKQSFDKDPNGIKYKFPDRSCMDCIRYPCFKNMNYCNCDFAKYGCINYKHRES